MDGAVEGKADDGIGRMRLKFELVKRASLTAVFDSLMPWLSRFAAYVSCLVDPVVLSLSDCPKNRNHRTQGWEAFSFRFSRCGIMANQSAKKMTLATAADQLELVGMDDQPA